MVECTLRIPAHLREVPRSIRGWSNLLTARPADCQSAFDRSLLPRGGCLRSSRRWNPAFAGPKALLWVSKSSPCPRSASLKRRLARAQARDSALYVRTGPSSELQDSSYPVADAPPWKQEREVGFASGPRSIAGAGSPGFPRSDHLQQSQLSDIHRYIARHSRRRLQPAARADSVVKSGRRPASRALWTCSSVPLLSLWVWLFEDDAATARAMYRAKNDACDSYAAQACS